MKKLSFIPSVEWDHKTQELLILDQTLLPAEEKILHIKDTASLYQAIYILAVRGAPAIGVAAAYGLYLGAKEISTAKKEDFLFALEQKRQYLASARPTAVNLRWALDRCFNAAKEEKSVEDICAKLLYEAEKIREEDIECCKKIGEHGLSLLHPGMGILTHCNAGRLAAISYGTALAPIYLGAEQGYNFHVFCDETRPLLQGARLTAYELSAAGIDTTLICDNMAASMMTEGKIDAVLVGCDRVAKNGDAANKIGTLGVAVLAKHFNIPFYVCAPFSTIDFSCQQGKDIPIEERDPAEIREKWYAMPMAPEGVKIKNPSFDVTPAELISAFITEKGVILPKDLPLWENKN